MAMKEGNGPLPLPFLSLGVQMPYSSVQYAKHVFLGPRGSLGVSRLIIAFLKSQNGARRFGSSLGYTKSSGPKIARPTNISALGDRKPRGTNAMIGLEEIGLHPQSLVHHLPIGLGAAVGDMGSEGSLVPRPGQRGTTWRLPSGTTSPRTRGKHGPGVGARG